MIVLPSLLFASAACREHRRHRADAVASASQSQTLQSISRLSSVLQLTEPYRHILIPIHTKLTPTFTKPAYHSTLAGARAIVCRASTQAKRSCLRRDGGGDSAAGRTCVGLNFACVACVSTSPQGLEQRLCWRDSLSRLDRQALKGEGLNPG